MRLNSLKPAKGALGKPKRIGRGEGSGHGGTSTRGMNGAKQRSGYSAKLGFQGGQMPIQRQLPKFGFNNPKKVEFKVINLSSLQALSEKLNVTTISRELLIENGLVSKNDLVKILGNGELTSKLDVTANAFSKSAIAKIEALKGTVTVIE
ncbi:MAG: 50S ribosomal protein L15 [Bacteroidales bacterium]|nr:50S ribosomal protein L15 [Bacteroidales bacterium]